MADEDKSTTPDQPQDTPASPANVSDDVRRGLWAAENLAVKGEPAITPQAQPIQTIPSDPSQTMIPSVQPWNFNGVDDQHLHGLRGILDRVASIMAPSDTYHVSKDENGMVNVTKTPATTGEKWGRIAAAALGGAASGLAQQGVNAPARSVASGFQVGQQVAQSNQTQAQQEAQAQQQLMLRNAQNAYLNQQIIHESLMNRDLPRQIAQQRAKEDLEFGDIIANHGGKDLGTFSSMQEVHDYTDAHPEVIDHHMGQGGSQLYTIPIDGGFHGYSLPHTAGAQRLTEAEQLPASLYRDPDNPTKFLKQDGDWVQPGTLRSTKHTSDMAVHAANDKVLAAIDLAKQREQGPKPGPPIQVNTTGGPMLYYLPTAQEPAGHWVPLHPPGGADVTGKLGTSAQDSELESLSRTAAGGALGPTTPAESASPTGGELGDEGRFLGQFTAQPTPQGQAILDRLPTGTANLVRRFGNYLADESKELPRGKERGPFLDLVSSVYPNFDSGSYPARAHLMQSIQGDGKMAQTRNALNLAIQHMGEMYTNMQKIDPGEYPLANEANRTWHLSAGFGDKDVKRAYGGYTDANEMVASEIARVFKGGAPTQGEINEFKGNTDITSPRSSQEGSFTTRAHMLASRLSILNRQLQDGFRTPNLNYQLLTPESIATLRRLPGGDEILRQAHIPVTPPPATGGGAAAAPAQRQNFDAAAWKRANPNGDVNAAIDQARRQNYNVINAP